MSNSTPPSLFCRRSGESIVRTAGHPLVAAGVSTSFGSRTKGPGVADLAEVSGNWRVARSPHIRMAPGAGAPGTRPGGPPCPESHPAPIPDRLTPSRRPSTGLSPRSGAPVPVVGAHLPMDGSGCGGRPHRVSRHHRAPSHRCACRRGAGSAIGTVDLPRRPDNACRRATGAAGRRSPARLDLSAGRSCSSGWASVDATRTAKTRLLCSTRGAHACGQWTGTSGMRSR